MSLQCSVYSIPVVIHHKLGGLNNTNLWYSSGGQKSEVGFSGLELRCSWATLLPQVVGENHSPPLFQLLEACTRWLMAPAIHQHSPTSAFHLHEFLRDYISLTDPPRERSFIGSVLGPVVQEGSARPLGSPGAKFAHEKVLYPQEWAILVCLLCPVMGWGQLGGGVDSMQQMQLQSPAAGTLCQLSACLPPSTLSLSWPPQMGMARWMWNLNFIPGTLGKLLDGLSQGSDTD